MIASITWFLFSSRLRITLTILVALTGLYALAGFVIVPWLARPRVVETIAELTGRETRLETLKLNPFTFSGSISGFEITDTDGETLLSVERAYANVQTFMFLFTGNIHLKEVDVTEPYFRLQVNQDGSLNIADIINQATAMMADSEAGQEAEPATFRLDLLRVTNGAIRFDDLSRSAPFTSTIAPISFDLTGFHTGGLSDAPYALAATSESGEAFSWEGNVAFNPLRSKGSFSVTGFSMPKYEPFYDIILATDVISGIIGVSGNYEYSSGEDGVMLLHDAAINIEDVQVVKGSDQAPILSLALGSISGARVDALTRTLEVAVVTLKDGTLFAKRLPDGQIDLISLIDQSVFSPEETEEAIADAPTGEAAEPEPVIAADPDAPAPSYAIHRVVLEGFSIELTDETIPVPATLALDKVTLQAENILSDAGALIGITIGANARTGGSLSVEGSVSYQPIKGTVNLELSELALDSANSYVSEFADVQITSGHITVSGQATIDLSGETPNGSFDGRFSLGELDVVGGDKGQPLVHLTRLDLDQIAANIEPRSVAIGAITIVDPQATILVNEDGTINLMQALRMGGDPAGEEASEGSGAEEVTEVAETVDGVQKPTGMALDFPVSIGSIKLENASATVTDRSITPSVTLGLETLSGTISGLSSEELARADLDLAGTLTGGTKLTMTGKINPLIADRYSDVVMTFKDFNLNQVSPYSGKYAGYALQKGKLSFDLNYSVSQAELAGENKVVIDQLTLGEQVESEDALNLPIPLAVSLMKDKDGMIEIDIPVTGNLNDPEFGFGRVISRAIVNVLTKIITSPFSLLGNLVAGGADVDLSYVAFAPGSTEFDDDTVDKLALLAKALDERPTLKVEIIGTAGGPAESNLLKLQQLDDNLRVIRWRELKDAGDKSIRLADVTLTPEDRDRLIIHSFNLMFPAQAVDSTAAVAEADNTRASARAAPTQATTAVTDTTADAVPASAEDDAPGGLAGFFRKIFGGDTKITAETLPSAPVAPAPKPEPAQAGAQTEPPETGATSPAPEDAALTVDQMASRLIETLVVSDEVLRGLASARADAVRIHLENVGATAPDRLFVMEPEEPGLISADDGETKVIFKLE